MWHLLGKHILWVNCPVSLCYILRAEKPDGNTCEYVNNGNTSSLFISQGYHWVLVLKTCSKSLRVRWWIINWNRNQYSTPVLLNVSEWYISIYSSYTFLPVFFTELASCVMKMENVYWTNSFWTQSKTVGLIKSKTEINVI